MSNLNEFLNKLSGLGVKLWIESTGETNLAKFRLKYNAPKGTITPVVISELKEHKEGIIQFLQQANYGKDRTSQTIQPAPKNIDLPLSFAQQRLWFLEQLEGSSFTYNWPVSFRLQGNLNISVLEQSLTEIARRHEILRTNFSVVNGTPVQKINATQPIHLPVIDLQSLPELEREAEAKKLVKKEKEFAFDLAEGSLFRVMLLRLQPQENLLTLSMHHIVTDGWFLGIFIHELSVLYSAFCAGKPSPLSELPIQYGDFAYWQRQHFQGEVLQRQVDYWKQQLAGIPPLLELPTDRPRPPIQTFPGAIEELSIDRELTQKLKDLTQQSGATLFMTLLSAFAILLYRYSGQSDIVIGSPIANRNRSELEGLIGFFVNSLALRIKLKDSPTFLELLNQVKQVSLNAYEHQDLPFEKLVEELQPERSLSYPPIFQTLFTLQNYPMGELELPGLTMTMKGREEAVAQFDLSLDIMEIDEILAQTLSERYELGLRTTWEYNTDLFDAGTIARMKQHYLTLLEAIVANPQQKVDQLPILTATEEQQILVEWNDTQKEYSQNLCIHNLFEAQVEKTPDAIAVKFADRELTYQELNTRANQLAHYLRSLGVEPEVLVGICIDRSLDMLVGLLAILKAGGAYVPLDPIYPRDRLEYMLDDAQVQVLLTESKLKDNLDFYTGKIVYLDSNWQDISKQEKQDNLITEVKPNNLAYTIYTSGSTGKPKGVQINHQAVVNFLTAINHEIGLTEQDILLAVTTICFDIAVLELYLPLIIGAKVVIASSNDVLDGKQLGNLLQQEQVTVMQATPAGWRLLLSVGWQPNLNLKILSGGEAFPPALARQLQSNGNSVWNLYGPTEATVWTTVYQLPVDSKGDSRIAPESASVLIGRPLANTQIYILDSQLQPVPIGVPGEVYIGGTGLARGYLNRPELTKKRFIKKSMGANRFVGANGETLSLGGFPDLRKVSNPKGRSPLRDKRIYKTGDLGKYRPDGNIELIGRIDNQVKIRGFRIELGEIETVLGQHFQVEQAAVIVTTEGDNSRLTAYIVTTENLPTISELRQFLKQKLPEYMIPSLFITLESMPLTNNGKIDRQALPQLEGIRPELAANYVMPTTQVESKIAAIWQEVLQLDKVGIHDNFFDLGGHSLLVVQVHSQLQEIAPNQISMLEMFMYPTIHALAQKLTIESNSDSLSGNSANRAIDRKTRQNKMSQRRQNRRLRRSTNQA